MASGSGSGVVGASADCDSWNL